ncbi:DUF1737 domain-containing protein [Escherichia coli]
MSKKHFELITAMNRQELAEKVNERLALGWQLQGNAQVASEPGVPWYLMQSMTLEGDIPENATIVVHDDGSTTITTPSGGEPEWYYVVVTAGQSNSMAYGEGLPLPDSYDQTDPRIKQLARRNKVTPTGEACAYNDIIPADHCLHDVQDMSKYNHPKADLSKGQYGCVSQGLHIAKRMLPYIPANAGILLVPCGRGGAGFTVGNNGSFSEQSGATENSTKWGSGTALYQDLISRTKAALAKDPKNVLLAVCWMQGEADMTTTQNAGQHKAMFTEMVKKFRADLTDVAAQCNKGDPESVPWICGDTTYYWKNTYAAQYETVYGGYKQSSEQNVFFVPFMTDEYGQNTATNVPGEDPDLADAGYYGAQSRTQGNWVSQDRDSHFSSWARRGIIADRMASAILQHAGRTLPFIQGTLPEYTAKSQDEPEAQEGGDDAPESADTGEISLLASGGDLTTQGWTLTDATSEMNGDALRIVKQEGKTWTLTHPVENPLDLLTRGGTLTCKFRLYGALTNNQFGLGIYLHSTEAVPQEIAMTGTGNPFIMAYFTQTTDGKLNLMHHKKAGNAKIGGFGDYSNDWQTLKLTFTAGSAEVTPTLNDVPGTPFLAIKDSLTLGLNALTLTDITKSATYGVELESVTLEINPAPAG